MITSDRSSRLSALHHAVRSSYSPLFASLPECRLILFNISKKSNLGQLIRTAVAMGVSALCVITPNRKSKQNNDERSNVSVSDEQLKHIVATPFSNAKPLLSKPSFNVFGHQNTLKYMPIFEYSSIESCIAELKNEGFKILGCEIHFSAISVYDSKVPFSHKTAFVLGNEGSGLDQRTIKLCDKLIYIPQYGIGTHSLNVHAACAILLSVFGNWAKYPISRISEFKFDVDESKAIKRNGQVSQQNIEIIESDQLII